MNGLCVRVGCREFHVQYFLQVRPRSHNATCGILCNSSCPISKRNSRARKKATKIIKGLEKLPYEKVFGAFKFRKKDNLRKM